jgi:hypothetical protein
MNSSLSLHVGTTAWLIAGILVLDVKTVYERDLVTAAPPAACRDGRDALRS